MHCPLQHISAPLMEFERQRLIKQFKAELQSTATEGDEPAEESPKEEPQEGEGPPVYVDYK